MSASREPGKLYKDMAEQSTKKEMKVPSQIKGEQIQLQPVTKQVISQTFTPNEPQRGVLFITHSWAMNTKSQG